uniref:Endo/exonuclease/phosphatase domain-containing protein n=1 Tax=Angiostrongylus cantonensis TaxID=6313 RepID=A0A0K0CUL5_ANGCA
MEAAWIKNYGDDLYLQYTYTYNRVLDRRLAHASKNDKVTIGDFNAKIGQRRSSEERHIGTHGLEWNEQVEDQQDRAIVQEGDLHDIGSYRLICLLSVVYKLFTGVILSRIDRTLYEGQP